MKRLLLLIALLPGIACAAQQSINYTSTVKWNVVGPVIQSNFTELYTNKADKTSFASQSAFTTAWGWNPGGGVSAWSDIQALLTGDGDWVKRDGSTGTPIGTLPTGTDGQTIQYDSSGAPAAVDLAPLAFTDNVSRNTTTGVVSVPVTATTTSGSAVPFTSGGAYTALAGKQDADADLTTAAGATGAGNSKYFGTNSGGTAGFYDLPDGGSGSFTFDTFPAYKDSAHSSGIAVNGTTLAVYSSTAGKWLTVGLTDSLNASGSCTSTSYLVDQTGAWAADGAQIADATAGVVGTFVGNGKKIKSITVKTSPGSIGGSTANVYINSALDFSGTVLGTSVATVPGENTTFTFPFNDGPVLSNATPYYFGIFSSTVAWGTRFSLARVGTVTASDYYSSSDGVDGPFTGPNGVAGLWVQVEVCDN